MKNNKTYHLAAAAVLAVLTFIFTAYLGHFPIGQGGYIHFGDSIIYLAASLLPAPFSFFCVFGAVLADVSAAAHIWIVPTIIVKTAIVILFSSKGDKILTKKNLIMSAVAGVVGIVGYYIAEGIIYGNFLAPMVSVPFGLIQAGGSMIFYVLIAYFMDRAKFKDYIK